jgi:hypothetical protein
MAGMRGLIVALGVGALALTACATQPEAAQQPSSTASPSPSASPSGSPSAAPNVIFGEARPVTPRPGMTGLHPLTWQATRLLSDRVIRVYFYAGAEPCTVLDSVKVDYGTNDIAIGLFGGVDPTAQNATCSQDVMLKDVEITLDEDVEGRPFRDPSRPTGIAADTTPDLGTIAATPHPDSTTGPRMIAWDRVQQLPNNVLRIYYSAGSCDLLDHVELIYAREVIRVTVLLGSPNGPIPPCVPGMQFLYSDVNLREPVDGRDLVDGSITD